VDIVDSNKILAERGEWVCGIVA